MTQSYENLRVIILLVFQQVDHLSHGSAFRNCTLQSYHTAFHNHGHLDRLYYTEAHATTCLLRFWYRTLVLQSRSAKKFAQSNPTIFNDEIFCCWFKLKSILLKNVYSALQGFYSEALMLKSIGSHSQSKKRAHLPYKITRRVTNRDSLTKGFLSRADGWRVLLLNLAFPLVSGWPSHANGTSWVIQQSPGLFWSWCKPATIQPPLHCSLYKQYAW